MEYAKHKFSFPYKDQQNYQKLQKNIRNMTKNVRKEKEWKVLPNLKFSISANIQKVKWKGEEERKYFKI